MVVVCHLIHLVKSGEEGGMFLNEEDRNLTTDIRTSSMGKMKMFLIDHSKRYLFLFKVVIEVKVLRLHEFAHPSKAGIVNLCNLSTDLSSTGSTTY